MELDNNTSDKKYIRAKNRVDQLRKYYRHLSIYIVVNTLLSIFHIVNEVSDGETLKDALLNFNTFSLWVWWGIGIAFHTYRIFGNNLLFMNKDWEEKKIKEFMNEK